MYHSWLDRWDERRAQSGEQAKRISHLVLDGERAFPDGTKIHTVEEFCVRSEQAVSDPAFFDRPSGSDAGFEKRGEWLKFPSDLSTDVEENNVVWTKITDSGSADQALVIFHHWNASARNRRLASFFSKRGITVAEIALPYHLERSRAGSWHADYMLSANLGRTIQSVRQAVLDGRKLIRWLTGEGYRNVSVLGVSLGSWVAGLTAAHDTAVSKASLFLTAGSLADMVWTGRATRAIHDGLEPEMSLMDLRRAWGPLDLSNYADRLARQGLVLHSVLAKRDRVVLPELSTQFIKKLESAGAKPDILRLNCGHYSLALPPYALFTGLSLRRFLSSSNVSTQ